VFPLLAGISLYFPIKIGGVFELIIGLLQLITTGFLGVALYRIKKQLQSANGNEQVDIRLLMLDIIACVLFFLSSVTLYFYPGLVYLITGESNDLFYVLYTVSNALSFIQQMILCYIFVQVPKPPPEKLDASTKSSSTKSSSTTSFHNFNYTGAP
jgi:hypothetical protein